MSIRKKRHLIAGTIIGGLLLAATTQTGNSFALSNTSSPSTSGVPSTSQQTPTATTDGSTPSGDSTSTTPATPAGSTASGSTATQSGNTTAGVTSSATDPSSSTAPSPSDPPSGSTTNGTANTTTVTNTVDSNASTGDASVKHTTSGGNATSGNASAGTTLINNIASTSNLNSGTLQTFNYNIDGTQNGNVVINPDDIVTTSSTGSVIPADCPPTGATTANNNAAINNLVNLLAQTGNAKVSDNGVGGDATSGNATTEANIINTIQDLVSDKGAFLGVINVNGNLNGNIELPASVISSLLTPTSNGGATSNSTATNNTNVNNNVTLTAITGNAAVTNNGTGGSATSGNASTILQTCNLINSNIVGGNLLLVFVNVMGHWYGALLSEPVGDTTATLGGGITQDTVSPTQQTTAINNSTINNDVNLTSISGNATVANNGVGGNATTGSATAIADVTNILGSQINLSGWLGILVINVFGTWDGSLVVQPISTAGPVSSNGGNHTQISSRHTDPVDLGGGSGYYIVNPPQSFDEGQFDLASVQIPSANTTASSVLGAGVRQTAIKANHSTQSAKHIAVDFILAGIGLAFAITGGVSRFFANRRNNL